MRVAVRTVAVLMAAYALTGCTAGATTTDPKPPTVVVAAGAGSDIGNDRPQVTYDGLMVRRRVAVAIHSAPDADLAALRKQLDLAATRRHTTLSTISASVLDPAVLARLGPDLVVYLPAGATRADAAKLIDPAFAEGRRISDEAQEYDVIPVLVHDLRFTVGTANPAGLARDIAREGILSDALGIYTTTLRTHALDIAYTGPLLSDHLVESVRTGIARPADISPDVVAVSPRSTTGSGVDMAREPAPAPAPIQASTGHNHGAELPTAGRSPTGHNHGAELPTAGRSPASNSWAMAGFATVALIGLALVLHTTKRLNPPDED
jgi:hypothetical protein